MIDIELRFHPAAAREASSAKTWYEARSPRAAEAFVVELEHAVARVLKAPERWPKIARSARCYVFPRFLFSLVYRVTPNMIEVVAIAHHRRKPGYWGSR